MTTIGFILLLILTFFVGALTGIISGFFVTVLIAAKKYEPEIVLEDECHISDIYKKELERMEDDLHG